MREYADELRRHGRTVWYSKLDDNSGDWFATLGELCQQHDVTELVAMRQNDKTPQRRLEAWCKENNVALSITPNTMFLTSTSVFNEWADGQKRLQLELFYRYQRKRLNILMDDAGKPVGGKWNYDSENRKPLPKSMTLPEIALPAPSNTRLISKNLSTKTLQTTQEVTTLIGYQSPVNKPANGSKIS